MDGGPNSTNSSQGGSVGGGGAGGAGGGGAGYGEPMGMPQGGQQQQQQQQQVPQFQGGQYQDPSLLQQQQHHQQQQQQPRLDGGFGGAIMMPYGMHPGMQMPPHMQMGVPMGDGGGMDGGMAAMVPGGMMMPAYQPNPMENNLMLDPMMGGMQFGFDGGDPHQGGVQMVPMSPPPQQQQQQQLGLGGGAGGGRTRDGGAGGQGPPSPSTGIERGSQPVSTRVFVGNLNYDTTDDELRDHMASAGTVVSVQLFRQAVTGRSKGCAIVEYASAEEANTAAETLSSSLLAERNIFVREDRGNLPNSSGRRGGMRGGFRGGIGRGGMGGGGRFRGQMMGGPRGGGGYMGGRFAGGRGMAPPNFMYGYGGMAGAAATAGRGPCYTCGNMGHFARDCPMGMGPGGFRRGGGGGGRYGGRYMRGGPGGGYRGRFGGGRGGGGRGRGGGGPGGRGGSGEGGEPGENAGKQLFVGNLPFSTTTEELTELVEAATSESVAEANIVTGYDGRSRGFAIVVMETEEAATVAIEALDGTEVGEREIAVRLDKWV